MKQRIISSVVGIFILICVLLFYKTIVLNIAISIISAIAVYELLLATKYVENNVLAATCLIFSISVPFFRTFNVYKFLVPISIVFVFVLFMIMIAMHDIVKIEQIGLSFFISVIIPFGLSTLIYIRDKFITSPYVSIFYMLLALGSAWVSDSGAYFIGTFLGKTPLVPEISPKKTVEGVVGGVISLLIFGVIISLIFSYLFYKTNIHINYFMMFLTLPIASVMGVLGDLSASLIKRQCAIKDFGTIMPGHGGVLDRFDSVLFTVPFYYLVELFFSLIK